MATQRPPTSTVPNPADWVPSAVEHLELSDAYLDDLIARALVNRRRGYTYVGLSRGGAMGRYTRLCSHVSRAAGS